MIAELDKTKLQSEEPEVERQDFGHLPPAVARTAAVQVAGTCWPHALNRFYNSESKQNTLPGKEDMALTIDSVHLSEIKVIKPQVLGDARGFFMETFRADHFGAMGLPTEFPQDNHSRSGKHVLRGLHFQWDPPMGKLMRVTRGSAFLVAVDVRKGSPTLGQWFGLEVSAENKMQVWAPFGFARGFCALTDDCEVQYKCTGIYNPQGESGIYFADPAIAIRWPVDPAGALVSEKDRKAQTLARWLESPLSDNITYHAKMTKEA